MIKWKKLPKIQDIILYGSDEDEIKFHYDDGYEKYDTKKTFEGVINNLERRYLEADSDWKKKFLNIKAKQIVKSARTKIKR